MNNTLEFMFTKSYYIKSKEKNKRLLTNCYHLENCKIKAIKFWKQQRKVGKACTKSLPKFFLKMAAKDNIEKLVQNHVSEKLVQNHVSRRQTQIQE